MSISQTRYLLAFGVFGFFLFCLQPLLAETQDFPDSWNQLFSSERVCDRSPDHLSLEEMTEDLEVLQRLLDRAYAGEKELPAAGRSLNNRIRAIESQMSTGNRRTIVEFLNSIHENFRSIQDANLAFVLYRPDGRSEIRRARYHSQAYHSQLRFEAASRNPQVLNPEHLDLPEASRLHSCQGLRRADRHLEAFVQLNENGQPVLDYRLVQYSERPIRRVTCFFRTPDRQRLRREVPFDRNRTENPDSQPGVDDKSAPQMPLVRPATFEFTWLGSTSFWPERIAQLRTQPSLLLDLRGRSGNWSLAARRFAEALAGEKFDRFRKDRLESETSLEGGRHFYFCNRNRLADPFVQVYRDAYTSRLRSLWDPRKGDQDFKRFNRNIENEEAEWLSKAKEEHPDSYEYAGWLALIINRDCEGACEELVSALSQRNQVIVVGENTYGALSYGGVLEYYLPNSRIRVRIPSERHRSRGRARLPSEGIGIKPDFHITDLNPVPVTRQILGCLMEKTCPDLSAQLRR